MTRTSLAALTRVILRTALILACKCALTIVLIAMVIICAALIINVMFASVTWERVQAFPKARYLLHGAWSGTRRTYRALTS